MVKDKDFCAVHEQLQRLTGVVMAASTSESAEMGAIARDEMFTAANLCRRGLHVYEQAKSNMDGGGR